MTNQFNKESLQMLGIFELRNLARKIGVYSPTIYKKNVLIDKILSIINGEEEPYTPKSKQGRPPKDINSVNNLLDIFIPNDTFKTSNKNEDDYISMSEDIEELSKLTALNSSQIEINYANKDTKKVKAILEVFPEGYGFCYEEGCSSASSNIENNYFVAQHMISAYNLKTGDILKGYVKKISKDKPSILYKLETINYIKANQFNVNRKDFDELLAQYPTEKFIFESNNKLNDIYFEKFLPLGKGQRVLINVSKGSDYTSLISYFLNSIKSGDNLQKKCILIEERPEDITEYSLILNDSDIISTKVNEDPKQSIQKVELSVEQAKRSVEAGKNVVLVISNLNRLEKMYRKKFILEQKGFEKQIDMLSVNMIKKMLINARKTTNAGTLTIIAILEEVEGESELNSVKEIANMMIHLRDSSYDLPNKIWFNTLKSRTVKSNRLLSFKDYANLVRFKSDLTPENMEKRTNSLEKELLNN